MAVPLFAIGFPNLLAANGVTVSGGSWLPAAPVTNVATWPLSEDARSTDSLVASTVIDIDHGVAKSAQALVIMRHGLSASATVRWTRGTTPGGSDVADSGAVAAWAFSPRSGSPGQLYDAQVVLAGATSARYERILIDDTGNAYVSIGRVMICPLLAPAYGAAYGLRDSHVERSVVGRGQSGAAWPDPQTRARAVTFTLPAATLAEGDALHEMEQIEGTTAEVAYLPYGDSPERRQRYGFVGLLRELSGLEYPAWRMRSKAVAIEQRM